MKTRGKLLESVNDTEELKSQAVPHDIVLSSGTIVYVI